MYQRPQNGYLRVNKTSKNIRESNFDKVLNVMPQPSQPQPQTQVYIIDKNDFKSLVQKLTSPQSCVPQNLPNHLQDIRPEPMNRITSSSIHPSAMAVHQEDPDVSLYMSYLQSLLDESGSNEDQFEQPFDNNSHHFHMLAQAHSQPQVAPKEAMPQCNGFEPVVMPTTTLNSSWFNGSPQQMHCATSLQSTRVHEYPPQPLTPNLTFSSMNNQHGAFGLDLDCFDPDIFEFPY